MANIKKIKLSDGSVYSIFDEGALRLNADNILITGNSVVDEVILKGKLEIQEIDDVPVANTIDNVLVGVNVAKSGETPLYQVKKRSTDQLLEDIGGISYSMNSADGTLAFKFGKQTS